MRKSSGSSEIRVLIDEFVTRLVQTIEADAAQRVRNAVVGALGATGGLSIPKRRGRPPKNALSATQSGFSLLLPAAPVKRRPKQLCPVPGCKNPAAPVFGMVCSKHKDIPKPEIKKFREQRRASKDEVS